MENHIKIGDFVKLTGSTLKTVIHYHRIGLLPEPQRSPAGYRLYGPAELTRMRLIKRCKALGLDLNRIKEVLWDLHDCKTLREVLQSLQVELLKEKMNLEERLAKIEVLLSQDTILMDEDALDSPSFQIMTEIMGADQREKYARTCPESFDRQRKLCAILDDFGWGPDYRDTFLALAGYWKAHPRHYQMALDCGAGFERLAHLPEDDPEVEVLARKAIELIKNIPLLTELARNQWSPMESLFKEMVVGALSPAQIKYNRLVQQYFDTQS